ICLSAASNHEILIDFFHSTRSLDVSTELMESGRSPATEGMEVTNSNLFVVVRPPQGKFPSSLPISHDHRPPNTFRVDTHFNFECSCSVDHLLDEHSISLNIVRPLELLDVQPQSSHVVSTRGAKRRDGLCDL
ncbi:hypothetical protein PFISCL1PPCAC_1455, partial [Pristionchus fissidentatus]